MSGENTHAVRNHFIEGRAAHAECSARLLRNVSMSVGAFYSEDEKRRVHEESGLRAAGQAQARGASPAKRHDNVAHSADLSCDLCR